MDITERSRKVRIVLASSRLRLTALQQRLENLDQVEVSCHEVARATNDLCASNAYYAVDGARELAIKGIIDETGGTVEWKKEVKLDGGKIIKPDRYEKLRDFFIAIYELKNTLGIHGDAHLQAILDYSKIVTQNKVRMSHLHPFEPLAYLCLVQALP